MKSFLLFLFFLSYFDVRAVELIPFSQNEQWGFCDKFRAIVFPARYLSVSRFSDGIAKVETQKGSYAFLYLSGTMRSEIFIHHDARDFQDGMAAIQDKKNKKWGFINTELEITVSCAYDHVGNFHNGMVWAEKSGKTGYIDKKGNTIIPFLYSAGKNLEDDLIPVKKGEMWGYINTSGKVIIDFKYKSAGAFSQKIAVVSEDMKQFFFIDNTGKPLFNRKFDYCASFSEGMATVGINRLGTSLLYGVINMKGELIIPTEYGFIYPFSEGKAVCCINGKYGYIDKNGDAVIPFEYYFAEAFQHGYAQVWTSIQKTTEKAGNATTVINLLSAPIYINHKNEKYCNVKGSKQ